MTEEVAPEQVNVTTQQPQTTQQVDTAPQPSQGFVIPDKFKDRGWAKNFEGKGLEDFLASYDSAQSHIGKLTAERNPDLGKMTPEEREAHYSKIRPKDFNEYAFPEGITDQEKSIYGNLLHKHGLSKVQADGLLSEYMQTMQQARDSLYSKDGFINEMKKSFGDGFDEAAKNASVFMKKFLSSEDQALLETVPNEHLGLVYRLTNALKNAYGVKESDAGMQTNKTGVQVDVDAQLKDVKSKLESISRRPHTIEEKNKLLQEYNNLSQMRK